MLARPTPRSCCSTRRSGVEPQTLRLFEVARARGIPLLTFINKYDRPGMEPLEMLDHVESVLGIAPVAATWPVGIPGDFRGVVDRSDRHVPPVHPDRGWRDGRTGGAADA